MFFYTENLVSQKLLTGVNPWEFQATETITKQIRMVKEDRQAWYQNPGTRHQFYTLIEPLNPQLRVSKENPPHKIHGFAVDYDVPIPDERLNELIASLPFKPAWIETSLGGNRRLVFLLPQPYLVGNYDFAVLVLQGLKKRFKLDLLPGLDEPALETVTRLYANGGVWTQTGAGPIPQHEAQSFFVECAKAFRFKASDDSNIPLDVVKKELEKKFPDMNWPGDFAEEEQGPSFWIPDSTSPMSAIIKKNGMMSFAAHAEQPFYGWAHPALLGKEFCSTFVKEAMSSATLDIWFDGKNYYRKIGEKYEGCGRQETLDHLEVDCHMSNKADSTGTSTMKIALNHIQTQNRIKGAGPFAHRPAGLIDFQGERVLNTWRGKPLQPATGPQCWGHEGLFPLISKVLDHLFDPALVQLDWFRAWLKYYYTNVLLGTPQPGQHLFMLGGVGIGKTLVNRHLVAKLVGGGVDAVNYLVDGENFNSHLFEHGHWQLDDDTPAVSQADVYRLTARMKKMAANDCFVVNEKFMKQCQTQWFGRIICTANLDSSSSRIMGPMDNGSKDKISLLRCATKPGFEFPSRPETIAAMERELPYFAKWLLDWTVPDSVPKHSRFGVAAYHDPSMLDMAHQSNPIAPFKELLMEVMVEYFKSHKDKTEWRGSANSLIKFIATDPMNEYIMRSMKPDQINRILEQIEKEGILRCKVATEDGTRTRIWTFFPPAAPSVPQVEPPPADNSNFQK